MKFIPVPGTEVLFCIHETRRQDYAAYAKEARALSSSWKTAQKDGVPCGDQPDHPACTVNWQEANGFCAWLSKKEGRVYRLPTDREWSVAVGLGDREPAGSDMTPAALGSMGRTELPYGSNFPPLSMGKPAGNYADESYHDKFHSMRWIIGLNDGFPTTAPVMSFAPNALGIYDMGGNVAEWVGDWSDLKKDRRVLRGGSWEDQGVGGLYSAQRTAMEVYPHLNRNGFRCVLESGSKPTVAKLATPAPVLSQPPQRPAAAPAKNALTNSLGMTFVPVTGSGVLFCIHETRRQDYAAFAKEKPEAGDAWKAPKFYDTPVGHKDDHPVSGVSWDEATAFCAWLSQKEGRRYRLPTDREWSIAAGLAAIEKVTPNTTPETLDKLDHAGFPYGTSFPPPQAPPVGNFGDEILHRQFLDACWIEGYYDGSLTSAPVMSYPPNEFGLYDLAGNALEWCQDWYNAKQLERVRRGSSWMASAPWFLYSARRLPAAGDKHFPESGFRCVLETP